MITCKFGGSCTTNENNLKNIKQIINNKKRKIIIFSAIGKINNKNKKLTDYLFDFYEEKLISQKNIILNKIIQILNFLKEKTSSKINLNYFLKKIKNSQDKNYAVSRGEDLTARMMSQFLKIDYIPAEKLLILKNGHIDEKQTKRKVKKALRQHKRFCTGGFYGFDQSLKKVVLLERGGGDVSGAIFAKLSDSSIYENYTDIDGVKMANPTTVKNPKTIKKISYEDLKIICGADGKVLHKDVCTILNGTKVVTLVKSIFQPRGQKTKISSINCNSKFVCCEEENGLARFVIRRKTKIDEVVVKEEMIKETYNMLYRSILKG